MGFVPGAGLCAKFGVCWASERLRKAGGAPCYLLRALCVREGNFPPNCAAKPHSREENQFCSGLKKIIITTTKQITKFAKKDNYLTGYAFDLKSLSQKTVPGEPL